jgi:hemoglobin/transferrin/lactoferrin receptor protein
MNRRITNSVTTININGTGPNPVSYGRASYQTSDSGIAPFQGRVGLKWRKDLEPGRAVYTDLYANWATSAKNYRYDSDYTLGFVTDHYPGWQTLNLTLGTEWGEEQKWNASLSLRNIGDQSYTRAENNIEDPGFHVVLGVGFEY